MTSFKPPHLLGEDILILVERLGELGYSPKPIIELLNKRPVQTSGYIL